MRKVSSQYKNILLLLIMVSLYLIAFELAARNFYNIPGSINYLRPPKGEYIISNDSKLQFIRSPGIGTPYDAKLLKKDFEPVSNSLGLREFEYGPKNPNKTRIVVLGDSITQGANVKFGEIYTKKLEKLLNRMEDGGNSSGSGQSARNGYEVISAGICGYNTVREVRFFEKYLSGLKPDILMVQYTPNDRYIFSQAKKYENGSVGYIDKSIDVEYLFDIPLNDYLIRHSYLYVFLNEKIINTARNMGIRIKAKHFVAGEHLNPALDRLKSLGRAKNFSTIFIIFPLLESKRAELENKWIINKLENKNIPYLSLLEPFKRYGLYSLRSSSYDDTHPNAKGHQIAAREIYKYLAENGYMSIK